MGANSALLTPLFLFFIQDLFRGIYSGHPQLLVFYSGGLFRTPTMIYSGHPQLFTFEDMGVLT
ncbi:MAG: hypothetical protein WBS20_03610, partial [Lysobacterales bacterium]